jgi:hypothetical protein
MNAKPLRNARLVVPEDAAAPSPEHERVVSVPQRDRQQVWMRSRSAPPGGAPFTGDGKKFRRLDANDFRSARGRVVLLVPFCQIQFLHDDRT